MNNQSEQIGELAKALSIAQGQIDGAVKTKKGNFGKHATLEDVWNCCRIPLSSNNLAVTQDFDVVNDKNIIITTLMHSSGQWKRGSMLMPIISPKVHDLMSSITYCRRYCLCAMIGIAPIDEDDDGQKANDSFKHAEKPKLIAVDFVFNDLAKCLIEFSKEDLADYVKYIAITLKTSEEDVINQTLSSEDRLKSFREKLKSRLDKKISQ